MRIACCIATCGDPAWSDLARRRALPSCAAQQPDELITVHRDVNDVCAARNAAARAATSDWLIFVDADDELEPGYLDALRPYLADTTLLLAPYVRYVRYEKGRRVVTSPRIPNAPAWPEMNELVTGTAIGRETFDAVGGWDSSFWPWSDWELWLRATRAGCTHIHIEKAVYRAYVTETSENARLAPADARTLHARIKKLHAPVWRDK